MVERFVAADQLLELVDDLQLGFIVLFLFGVRLGDEFVALATVFGEQALEALFLLVGRCDEFLGRAARFEERFAALFRFVAVGFVKGYLDGLHVGPQRLDGTGVQQPGELGDEFFFRLARVVGRPGGGSVLLVGGVLLVGVFFEFEFRGAGGEGRFFVREIDGDALPVFIGSGACRFAIVRFFRCRGRSLFFNGRVGCRGGDHRIFGAGGTDLFHGNRRVHLLVIHDS